MFRRYVLRNRSVAAWLAGAALLSSDGCSGGGVLETIFLAFRIADVWA